MVCNNFREGIRKIGGDLGGIWGSLGGKARKDITLNKKDDILH